MHAFEPKHDRHRDPAAAEADTEQAEQAADRVAHRILSHGTSAVAGDLSEVRIHHDEAATRSIGAFAYTHGRDVVLGDEAARSPAVVAHELGHVVAEGRRPGPARVRRRVRPEDVSAEMAGASMVTVDAVTLPGGIAPAGTKVVVVAWVNASATARVRFPAAAGRPAVEADVAKAVIRPDRPVAAGVAPYSARVTAQAASVTRGAAAIAAETARPGGPRPGEIPRMQGLQQTREEELNKRLIQETMFNRFDPLIKKWTDFYNAQAGYDAKTGLDPNLVKSMVFQESQMGTSGEHLMAVPPSPVSRKTRFNVGQVIDTSGPALLIMMTEIDPALVARHNVGGLRHDLVVAQNRHDKLTKKAALDAAETAELAGLNALSEPNGNWERFFWAYRAAGSPTTFSDAVLEFFTPAAGGVSRRMDYEFWIRTTIRWLFEKRKNESSWTEAIRAYNGSGAKAQAYREAVTGRSASAVKAQRAGTEFAPGNI